MKMPMTPKVKAPIKLTKEGLNGIRFGSVSDAKLIRILNAPPNNKEVSERAARWMAAQILGNYGYELEG